MALPRICIRKPGFTLIEVLVSITLLAVLAGFSLTVTLDSYRSYNFRSQQELLVSLLQRARAQAMANINQMPHGLHLDAASASYTLFQGGSFAYRDPSQDLIFTGNSVQSLSGLSDIIFTQLSGTTTAGSIILKDSFYQQAVINLNNEGQINLQ